MSDATLRFFAWLSSATLRFIYQIKDDLKNQDDLKNEDDLNNEDNLKNIDNLKNEDDLKNEDNLKNEDDHKNILPNNLSDPQNFFGHNLFLQKIF